LESNVALLRAASGFERLMAGGSKNGPIQDSNVAQISAALYYQAHVIAKLTSNRAFKETFQKTIYNQIMEDFGSYIDAKARMNPKSLHHVYEWKRVGQKDYRLFNLTMIDGEGISFKIKYQLKESKSFVPSPKGKRKHVFANKASIMEAGMPLVISPRHSERLVFEMNGMTVFMPKGASVTVRKPGGAKARNQFYLAYSQFFKGNLVNESIKRSGFQQIFNAASAKALRIPSSIKKVQYSFSPNSVRSEADLAAATAFGGAMI
jgi:hypothetical protein